MIFITFVLAKNDYIKRWAGNGQQKYDVGKGQAISIYV